MPRRDFSNRLFIMLFIVALVAMLLFLPGRTVLAATSGDIIITELMYNPGTNNQNDEFLELYNDTDDTINLNGWCFTAGIALCFTASHNIAAGSYAIISPSSSQTTATYNVATLATYTGNLSNGGETITLKDNNSNVIDTVTYSDSSPWPTAPDGTGPSLEMKLLNLDNSLAASWGASLSGGGTPGEENSLANLDYADIANVSKPTNVLPTDSPVVTVQVEGATSVELVYRLNFETEQTIVMYDDGLHEDGVAADGLYGASIPSQAAGSLVRYKVEATNNDGTISSPGPDDTINYLGYRVVNPSETGNTPIIEWFMPDNQYNELMASDPDIKPYFDCVVVYGDEVFDNAQIRLHGNYSASAEFAKKPFKIKLPKGHQLKMEGRLSYPLREFLLNSEFPNNKYVIAQVSWKIYEHAGFPVPENIKVQLNRNGQFDGVYTLMDKYGNEWRDLHPEFEDGEWFDAWHDKVTPDDNDYSSIENWYDGYFELNSAEEKRNYLLNTTDMPNIINLLAATAVSRGHDWSLTQNFQTYYDKGGTNRWSVYPWDLDLTLGNPGADPNHQISGVKDMIDPTDVPDYLEVEDRFFAKAIWDDPQFKLMYLRRVRTLVDELYVSRQITDWGNEFVDLAEDAIYRDYDKWFEAEDEQYAVARDYIQNVVGQNPYDPIVIKTAYDFMVYPGFYDEAPETPTAIEPLSPRNRIFIAVEKSVEAWIQRYTGALHDEGQIPDEQPEAPTVYINEVMYNPAGGQDHEFIELYNPNDYAVDMSSWVVEGVNYTLPGGSVIGANDYALLVRKDLEFRDYYGGDKYIIGEYSGGLANEGETITLKRSDTSVVSTLSYQTANPWPASANGGGTALAFVGMEGSAACWAASQTDGTPGAENIVDQDWVGVHGLTCQQPVMSPTSPAPAVAVSVENVSQKTKTAAYRSTPSSSQGQMDQDVSQDIDQPAPPIAETAQDSLHGNDDDSKDSTSSSGVPTWATTLLVVSGGIIMAYGSISALRNVKSKKK
jgi:hypothetical protein